MCMISGDKGNENKNFNQEWLKFCIDVKFAHGNDFYA